MAHTVRISAARGVAGPDEDVLAPMTADAKADWLNSMYRSFQDFILMKKTAGPSVP